MSNQDTDGVDLLQKMDQDADKFEKVHVDVERIPDAKIIIPSGMNVDDAIRTLFRIRQQENEITTFSEEVNCFPLDGARSLMLVLQAIYGWVEAKPSPGFFGPQPPAMRDLAISPTESVPVLWGGFQVPSLEAQINCGSCRNRDGQIVFTLFGSCKKKELPIIRALAQKVREFVREHSVYRGKAVRIEVDEDGDLVVDMPPEFIDVTDTGGAELIFSDDVMQEVRTNIFTPIERMEATIKAGVPTKRGILLEGEYGVGKTLAATITAQKCEEYGLTFIYVKNVEGLVSAIRFAQQYQPAVIFAEDIDQLLGSEERSEETNTLLNVLDGVDAKSSQLMVVLTTNHVDRLNSALMRPGRLDAVVSVLPPNAEAVERLLRHYGQSIIDPSVKLDKVGELLDGQIPAVIREVVERGKLFAIDRLTKKEYDAYLNDATPLKLKEKDLIRSGKSILKQRELLAGRKVEPEEPLVVQLERERKADIDKVETAIKELVGHAKEILERV